MDDALFRYVVVSYKRLPSQTN